jgi:ergothioneine biosynthesis protein EgtB
MGVGLPPNERAELLAWYRRNRRRSQALFDLVTDKAYYSRPIPLRNPVVFYEGHLPAFSFNTLAKRGLGRGSIDASLERLFARGIDPEAVDEDRVRDERNLWPPRDAVRRFVERADREVVACLEAAELDVAGQPLLDRAEAAFAVLEHEAMHQETLLYMWHCLSRGDKRVPDGYAPKVDGAVPAEEWVEVPAGRATLGVDPAAVRFSWDNERPSRVEQVAAFRVGRHDVTNARFLEFVDAGGYQDERWWRLPDREWLRSGHAAWPAFWVRRDGQWHWRGMFDLVPLPPSWPVYVTYAEAAAYARWRGARLMSEAEFQRAAYGTPHGEERRFPWGDDAPDATRGVFDFRSWDPEPAGSHPAGRSAWGVEDLVGNGWEWTSTPFAPFPGFEPLPSYPEYSADFFDGDHFVIKGASPATARELLRPSFRNWFRPRYPYVYATFRLAQDAS